MKHVVQRWTGKGWYDSLCSPYQTMSEVREHLSRYGWHYTTEYPYRIVDYKPKKVQKYVPTYKDQNSDKGMVTVNN
jgi:hypothetical protein